MLLSVRSGEYLFIFCEYPPKMLKKALPLIPQEKNYEKLIFHFKRKIGLINY